MTAKRFLHEDDKTELQTNIEAVEKVASDASRVAQDAATIAHEAYSPTNKPTASDVGALKVYTSFSELGLSEATATAKSVVNAMANNSILLVSCTLTPTDTALKFPIRYGLFRVIKVSNYYAEFSYNGNSGSNLSGSYGIPYVGFYNEASGNAPWTGWVELPDASKFLPLDGSVAMSGNLSIEKSEPVTKMKNTSNNRILQNTLYNGAVGNADFANYLDTKNYRSLRISPETENRASGVLFCEMKNGEWFAGKMYGEHNITCGTSDITAGTSALATGCYYDVYK